VTAPRPRPLCPQLNLLNLPPPSPPSPRKNSCLRHCLRSLKDKPEVETHARNSKYQVVELNEPPGQVTVMGRKWGTGLHRHVCMSSCLKISPDVDKSGDKTRTLDLFLTTRYALRTGGKICWDTTDRQYYNMSVTKMKKKTPASGLQIHIVYLHICVFFIYILLCVYVFIYFLFIYLLGRFQIISNTINKSVLSLPSLFVWFKNVTLQGKMYQSR
jgi:hypothetical protein